MRVQSSLDQLCYDGETVLEDVAGREAGVVLTSYRLLVFTPESAGPNLQTFHRPNVTGHTTGQRGHSRWFVAGAKWLGFGLVLTMFGAILDLDNVLEPVSTDGTTGTVGVGWLDEFFGLFNSAVRLLDDVLFFGGMLAVLGGVALLGWYWQTRGELITIELAGTDDVDLPAAGFDAGSIRSLQSAIEDPVADGSKPSNR